MIVNVQAYDVLGSTLSVTVSTVDRANSGLDSLPKFWARSTVPYGTGDSVSVPDFLFAVGEELLNMAYAASEAARSNRTAAADRVSG